MGSKKRKAEHIAPAAAEVTATPAAATAKAAKATKASAPSRHAHKHTDAAPTGLGQQLSAAPGRLAKEPVPLLSLSQPAAKWAPHAAPPSCCCSSPAAVVELELARAVALEMLRRKLASLAAKAGLRNVPLLSFERWRFAAKWAEDEPQLAATADDADADAPATAGVAGAIKSSQGQQKQRQKQKKQPSGDPVIPFGSLPVAPEPGLVSDLARAGVSAAAAVEVANKLAEVAAVAAAGLLKKRQQLASGKLPSCGPVKVDFHKHSLDLSCGGEFVKINRPAYGKLARLYRLHWISRVSHSATTAAQAGGSNPATTATASDSSSVGLAPEAAAARVAAMEASLAGQLQPPAAGQAALCAEWDSAETGIGREKGSHGSGSGTCSDSQDENHDCPGSDTGFDTDSCADTGMGSEDADLGDADHADHGRAGGSRAAARQVSAGADASGSSPVSSRSSTKGSARLLDAEARLAELEAAMSDTAAANVAAAAGAGAGGGHYAGNSSERAAFHCRLFALLLRYKSIQGHGFQAAAGPGVFGLLRQRLSVGFECFASPLNAHFTGFGSAFPDVDAPFGSSGSFFRMDLKHGSFEVNPPFVPSILTAAAQHMLQLLESAEAAKGALSFVVLMPGWKEVPGWQLLQHSRFLQQSLLVAAADHGYCDGASHQRKDAYRQSPYDSSILFMQTAAAAAKWPVKQQLLQELQVALASCCPSAAASDRQRKQRGVRDIELHGYGAPVRKAAVATKAAPAAAATAGATVGASKLPKRKAGAAGKAGKQEDPARKQPPQQQPAGVNLGQPKQDRQAQQSKGGSKKRKKLRG